MVAGSNVGVAKETLGSLGVLAPGIGILEPYSAFS